MLETKEYGNLAAPLMCKRLGVKSQHDAKKLEEAKHEVYLKGFNDGVMIIGSYKGKKVRPPMAAAGDLVVKGHWTAGGCRGLLATCAQTHWLGQAVSRPLQAVLAPAGGDTWLQTLTTIQAGPVKLPFCIAPWSGLFQSQWLCAVWYRGLQQPKR